MERREFLKLTLGFTAAAGAIVATAAAAQAAPMLPPVSDTPRTTDPAAARTETDQLEHETAAREGGFAAPDTDFSAQRYWRRRRRVFFRRRRRFWRRRRRGFF